LSLHDALPISLKTLTLCRLVLIYHVFSLSHQTSIVLLSVYLLYRHITYFVERLSSIRCGKITSRSSTSSFFIYFVKSRIATAPRSYVGWTIVVNVGRTIVASLVLLNPKTSRSSGTL